MFAVLRDRRFAALFASQVASLLGTGILTVAIALLAARIAGDDAGVVLSIALTIRIATYVVISPIATALLAGRSSRAIQCEWRDDLQDNLADYIESTPNARCAEPA